MDRIVHAHWTSAAEHQLSGILSQREALQRALPSLDILWLFDDVPTVSKVHIQSLLNLPNLLTASPSLAIQAYSMCFWNFLDHFHEIDDMLCIVRPLHPLVYQSDRFAHLDRSL